MKEFNKTRDKSGSSIKNRLDGGDSDLRAADRKRVAIVNSRANKEMDYCSHSECVNRFADSSKAKILVVRGAR